jgi:hypothetical protein
MKKPRPAAKKPDREWYITNLVELVMHLDLEALKAVTVCAIDQALRQKLRQATAKPRPTAKSK